MTETGTPFFYGQALEQQRFSRVHVYHEQRGFFPVVIRWLWNIRRVRLACATDCEHAPRRPLFAEFVNLICKVSAAVHAGPRNFQLCSVLPRECPGKKFVQFRPYFRLFHISKNNLVLDSPRFFPLSPAHNFQFKTVVLRVNARRQIKNAVRNLAIILFPALHQGFRLQRFAFLFPRQAHFCICPRFQQFNIAALLLFVSGQKLFHDLPPLSERGSKGI